MKIGGIVCEYNPMHNGHLYHIKKTREAGATHIVCVMSGNYVQRGECAFASKWTRAEIALSLGADLVVDLPTAWSCDSAQNFAFGSVSILDELGIDFLSFGSEFDDAEMLKSCAKACDNEQVASLLKTEQQSGKSYPLALYNAVLSVYGKEYADVISSPNSTLALEYIKALNKLESKAEIFPLKRFSVSHDNPDLNGIFASAKAIRSLSYFEKAKAFMPEFAFEKIKAETQKGFAPCTLENGERAILSCLRSLSKEEMSIFSDDKTGLTDRIFTSSRTAENLTELFETAKTKNVTMAKIRRTVMRIFLGITPEISKQKPPYIKVLASNKKGFEILKNAKGNIPIITKHSDSLSLSDFGKKVYEAECKATDQFALFLKKIRACSLEQTSSVIIKK